MSFNISLSGLNAASSALDVASNNIANVGTNGYKESRAEFADIFAASSLGTSSNAVGAGVQLASVSQQFTQGNLNFTDNTLDLSVSGDGFFVMRPNQTSSELIYTRAGAFQVDQNGFIVNSASEVLQVFPVNTAGNVTTTSLSGTVPLTVPNTVGTPQATSTVNINLNFPAGEGPALPSAALDVELGINPASPNPNTFHRSTSATVFDEQGTSHILTMYFVMTNDIENTWEVRSTLDGQVMTPAVAGDEDLDFNNAGVLDVLNADGDATTTTGGANAGLIPYGIFPAAGNLPNGAAPLAISIDFRSTGNTVTQEAQGGFTVQSLSQDGFATGRLSGLEIDGTGLVRASFTNGQTSNLGKVAMARFQNTQGLRSLGNTSWSETVASGQAVSGEAGTGNFGNIQSGALENSNVDLTAELVSLITSQRNFQANSKAIETANAITQTIINIR